MGFQRMIHAQTFPVTSKQPQDALNPFQMSDRNDVPFSYGHFLCSPSLPSGKNSKVLCKCESGPVPAKRAASLRAPPCQRRGKVIRNDSHGPWFDKRKPA